MFRKIVSNLSLSPSAGSQLTYYLKRLQKEGITRKLSMVFAVGLVVLQIATIVSPTHASNVPSPNDIIWGGLNTADPKADLLNIYDQNHDSNGHTGYQNLFKYFGITRDEIVAASVGTINSGDHTLKSLGRNHKFADDQPVIVDGVTYYWRPLFEWGDHLTYPSVNGHRSDGSDFAIMVDCGNIVVRTIPVKPPKLQFSKTTMPGHPAAGAQLPPGAEFGYRMYFKNVGTGSATNIYITDLIPAHTKMTWQGGGMPGVGFSDGTLPGIGKGPYVWWIQPSLAPGAGGYVDFIVRINADTPNGTQICNSAYIGTAEIPTTKSAPPPTCFTVHKNAPPPPPPPPPPGVPRVKPTKTVSNLTTHVLTVTSTTASAGDTLEYRLINSNTGNGAAKNYLIDEDIADILVYADITDAGGSKLTGTLLTWPVVNIPAGGQVVKTFRVKVKSPIPADASTPNDPTRFDLRLDNIYGTKVTVKLPVPPPKQVEITTEKLPQTGGTTTSIILFAVIAGMIFFYLRNRQLVKELKMLRVDNVTGP